MKVGVFSVKIAKPSIPKKHDFKVREGGGLPEENPNRHGDNMQTLKRPWPPTYIHRRKKRERDEQQSQAAIVLGDTAPCW